jgi:hemoglobin
MKTDIRHRADIDILVDHFYSRVILDSQIGYFFNETFKKRWDKHLKLMCDFWENVIFYTGKYNGNPLDNHKKVHRKNAISNSDFNRWLYLFNQTVDELFQGDNAELIKRKALGISKVMQKNIQ